MNFEEFDACFDRFHSDVFRLETLQQYAVSDEDEDFHAFREGRPRVEERTVRTSTWLARIAVTTVQGKSWQRVHVVDHPLSEYLRYELTGYVESQACGEQILIADRVTDPRLEPLAQDFWLFDAESEHPYAVVMHYDAVGTPTDFEYTEDAALLQRFRDEKALVLDLATPLNVYLSRET